MSQDRHKKTDCSTDDTATAAHPSLELATEEVTGTAPLEGAPIGTVILRDCFVSLTYRGACGARVGGTLLVTRSRGAISRCGRRIILLFVSNDIGRNQGFTVFGIR
jgi:hypothetical protein